MRRVTSLYRSSVGKKVVMAATGVVLFGFVLGHLAGNLKIYQGPQKYDAYAHFLREVGAPVLGTGQALWGFRIVLLVCVALHAVAAAQTTRLSRNARGERNRKHRNLSFDYASSWMRWGGWAIALFVVYHLLHLTTGVAHPEFDPESAYRNVVSGFRLWPVSLVYLAAMVPLGLHVYHGLWSATQTLGAAHPTLLRFRRPVAAGTAAAIVIGNASIPLAVLAGMVR